MLMKNRILIMLKAHTTFIAYISFLNQEEVIISVLPDFSALFS